MIRPDRLRSDNLTDKSVILLNPEDFHFLKFKKKREKKRRNYGKSHKCEDLLYREMVLHTVKKESHTIIWHMKSYAMGIGIIFESARVKI